MVIEFYHRFNNKIAIQIDYVAKSAFDLLINHFV